MDFVRLGTNSFGSDLDSFGSDLEKRAPELLRG